MSLTVSMDKNFTSAPACIDQEIVSAAITTIASSCAKVFASMPEQEYLLDLANDDEFTRCHGFINGKIDGDRSIVIHHRVFKNLDAAEERYYFKMHGRTDGFDSSTPLGDLVRRLCAKVAELGFPCDWIDIRFEKGCIATEVSAWHFDSTFARSITISYSNNENFSTRIVNKSKQQISEMVPLTKSAVPDQY